MEAKRESPTASAWRRLLRRERTRAQEEAEAGGELNLVPYLDIVVNTVVFLLATTASALPLSSIEVRAPREVPVGDLRLEAGADGLQLAVAVGYRGFIVAAARGKVEIACGQRLGEGERCPARWQDGRWHDRYDYARLAALARRIKARFPTERAVTLLADAGVPYQVVVRTLDVLRGRASPPATSCRLARGCLLDRVTLGAGIQ
jgi:biopolymer transport protein ExbD